tara:strand:+ start:183 stop:518 length:336 start_codon:yes stop_codon:yes gene_type:complete
MNSIIQAQGLHHITLNGADKNTSINFWQNILGMKFIFEQPNLDDLNTNHLYFDCGDGTTVTVFTNESLKPVKQKLNNESGSVHHVAFLGKSKYYSCGRKKLKRKWVCKHRN